MGELNLNEDQYKKLGQLLSTAIKNKEIPHVSDLRRAAVLIYSLFEKGFPIDDVDLDIMLENYGEKYTKATKKFYKDTIDVCSVPVPGLKDDRNGEFRLKYFRRNKLFRY